MSRKNQLKPDPQPAAVAQHAVVEESPKEQTIEVHRQCPICWCRYKGVGRAYSKCGSTRYYKCTRTLTDNPPCGHTWTATVITEVIRIDYRVVSLDVR